MLRDELLAPLFAGMPADHPHHVAVWLGEVLGGPTAYTEGRGGLPAHGGQAADGPGHQRGSGRPWVELITRTADEIGLPEDPELRSAFVAYLEWGTRLARANSARAHHPPAQAPVPLWGAGRGATLRWVRCGSSRVRVACPTSHLPSRGPYRDPSGTPSW